MLNQSIVKKCQKTAGRRGGVIFLTHTVHVAVEIHTMRQSRLHHRTDCCSLTSRYNKKTYSCMATDHTVYWVQSAEGVLPPPPAIYAKYTPDIKALQKNNNHVNYLPLALHQRPLNRPISESRRLYESPISL